MTSKLREAIFKASNAHDLYDDGVDAIIDAVIEVLPEREYFDEGNVIYDKVAKGSYNRALEEVKSILLEAKKQ